jgi:hypothetical protein
MLVESTTGAVAVGREGSCCPTAFALPVPYQFGPLLRFLSPLIEPDVRNYRIKCGAPHFMRASRTYGSVRGAPSNGRPYRD